MNCIFCKNNSSASRSIEHIIPESVGNSKHILPRGIVCDKCNNYFARKIEKPLLDSEYFTQTRFRNYLPNKRGRIPPLENVLGPEDIGLGLSRDIDGLTHMYPVDEKDSKRFIEYVLTHKKGHFIIPQPSRVDPYLVSRFLAKIGLEVLTHKVMEFPAWEKELVFRSELDEVRHFARYGEVNKKWPFYERRLYDENHKFTSETGEALQTLHEFNTLYTKDTELYVVVIILGMEYTINLGAPKIEGYLKWLDENNYRSPLYPDGGI